MSNEKDDKDLEAIKRTRPKQTLEMNTPGGRSLQKDLSLIHISEPTRR